MKIIMKSILIISIACALIISMTSCSSSNSQINKTEINTFNTKSSDFKVAVISDTQLPPTQKQLDGNDEYLVNLEKALTVIKNNNVDMILFAGDIGDLGTRFAYQTYEDAIDKIFGDDQPIVQTIMGNHDYWNKSVFTAINHKKAFNEIIGHSPWTHYVVNGYHFIGASPDSGNMTKGYKNTLKWLENEIEIASKDSGSKPIFVMTHNQPENTSYGSEDWGDTTLNEVLKKYPNVINFSGHVHYSMLDERSIWQDDYTVINTQSLSYTELEKGKEGGTIPENAQATPMGYIIDFSNDDIKIHRYNFADGNMGKEEKADNVWTFALPYNNDKKYSFDNRKKDNTAPEITNELGNAIIKDGKIQLSFSSAKDDDFVHSYKVVIDDKDTKYFFSDFYNSINSMKKDVTIELDAPKDTTVNHTYKIYAVDSWNEESKNYIKIETNVE